MLFILSQCDSHFLSLYLSLVTAKHVQVSTKDKNNGEKNGNEIYGWNHMEQIAFISRLSFAFVEINSQSIYLTKCLPFFAPVRCTTIPTKTSKCPFDSFFLPFLLCCNMFFLSFMDLWSGNILLCELHCKWSKTIWKNNVRCSNKMRVLAFLCSSKKNMKTSLNQFDQTKITMIVWIKYHDNHFIGHSVFNR